MPDLINCPHCNTTGAKAYRRNMCTGCLASRQNTYMEGVRERDRQARAGSRSNADVVAMKGFSFLSQAFLSRKL